MTKENKNSQKEENAISYEEIAKKLGGTKIKLDTIKSNSSSINPLEIPEK